MDGQKRDHGIQPHRLVGLSRRSCFVKLDEMREFMYNISITQPNFYRKVDVNSYV